MTGIFEPTTSSNTIFFDENTDQCLTTKIEEIEGDVTALETGKANANHTHDGYASSSHTHSQYSQTSHTHTVSDIDSLGATLVRKADDDHTHTPASIGAAAASHTHTGFAAASHGHSYNDLSDKPTIPAAYTHPSSHPASMITGLAAVATSGSYNDLTNKPTIPTVPTSLPANGGNADTVDNKHASDFAAASHTHTPASIGAAASGHTHTAAALLAMASAMFGTNEIGGVEYSYGSGSGKNVLTEISNMPQGLHTIYAIAGTTGNPETAESYRYFVHKTSGTIGWVLAFGADGSIYSNYQSAAGTFKGWRTIHDTKRKPLWTGSYYMTAGHTATPSKKLSQCEHGWMLLWSDYDPDTNTVNNSDFATTLIPNRSWAGGTWNGSSFYCDVPRYSAGTATDSESRVIKLLTVYDNKLVGTDANNAAPRNDVILRAVYEF